MMGDISAHPHLVELRQREEESRITGDEGGALGHLHRDIQSEEGGTARLDVMPCRLSGGPSAPVDNVLDRNASVVVIRSTPMPKRMRDKTNVAEA